jgi:hypothetical protein
MSDLIVYEASRALAQTNRGNYSLTCAGQQLDLKRGVDFDNPVVQKTGKKAFDKPILQKPGAEKIVFAFGLLPIYTIESKIERHEQNNSFFYYAVRCDLCKFLPDGTSVVVTNSYGSANTGEKRNGFNSPADAANGTLKMAQKRALVGAALSISGISDMFTQDIENEKFMQSAENITKETPEQPITSKQIQRIYAIAANAGLNTEQAKTKIKAMGYVSTKDIRQKDYDAVCAEMEKG